MKKNAGFTLVELMIVVAIIGVISAIAFPSYDKFMKKTRRSDAMEGMLKINARLEKFSARGNSGYTTNLADLSISDVSEDGNYRFSITSDDLLSGFTITATAIDGGDQWDDTDCRTMTVNSVGVHGSNDDPTDANGCW